MPPSSFPLCQRTTQQNVRGEMLSDQHFGTNCCRGGGGCKNKIGAKYFMEKYFEENDFGENNFEVNFFVENYFGEYYFGVIYFGKSSGAACWKNGLWRDTPCPPPRVLLHRQRASTYAKKVSRLRRQFGATSFRCKLFRGKNYGAFFSFFFFVSSHFGGGEFPWFGSISEGKL